MSRPSNTTTASLRSMSGSFGAFQIVASPQSVVLDVQSQSWDVEGHLHRDCALAHLSIQEASRLRDLLSEAIITADTAEARQSGLWSETTTRPIASTLRKRRRS